MKQFKKIYVLPAVLLFALGTALGVQLDSAMSDTDVMEQLRKLEDAFLIINKRYVEEVELHAWLALATDPRIRQAVDLLTVGICIFRAETLA